MPELSTQPTCSIDVDAGTELLVIRSSMVSRMMVLVWACIIFVPITHTGWHFSKDPLDNFHRVTFMIALVLQVFDSLIRRTRFTDVGIDHRTWFGKRTIAAYSELSVLAEEQSISISVGEREFTLKGRKGEMEKVSEILRERVRNYLDSNYRF